MIIPLKFKIGIGILAGYSTYAAYLSLATNYEIRKRDRLYKDYLNARKEGSAGEAAAAILAMQHAEDSDQSMKRFNILKVGGRFENPFAEYRPHTLYEFFFARILELFEGRSRGNLPETDDMLRELLPIHRPFFEMIYNNAAQKETDLQDADIPPLSNRLTFTWLGQSCSYFQIAHVSFLTDPIFDNYLVSKKFGPKRITPSPCQLKDLPIPDFTLVSHNHPDHLEEESIKEIGNKTMWIVPLGLKKFLGRRGIYNVTEMEWWERLPLEVRNTNDEYEVVCLPAMHWSGRKIIDSNETLWCSFLILRNNKGIFYHAGDTGYSNDLFKIIYDKYGPVLFSMLPIGQYCPQWHQKPRHINPEEAIKIVHDLHGKHMVGVHWGTFILSSEYFMEPKLLLDKLASDANEVERIKVPDFGKTVCIDLEDDTVRPN